LENAIPDAITISWPYSLKSSQTKDKQRASYDHCDLILLYSQWWAPFLCCSTCCKTGFIYALPTHFL